MTKQENNELITIDTREFQKEIDRTKELTKNISSSVNLPILYENSGIFKLFKKDVTVYDINQLTKNIQNNIINQNKVLVKTIKEFENVYDTFSLLNKDYIMKIIASIQAADKANQEAQRSLKEISISNEKISKSNDVLKKHHNTLNDLIDNQGLILANLKKFKDDIMKIKHIQNVDVMYGDIIDIKEKIELLLIDAKNLNNIYEVIKKNIKEDNIEITALIEETNKNLNIQSNNIIKIKKENDKNKEYLLNLNNELIQFNKNNILTSSKLQNDLDNKYKKLGETQERLDNQLKNEKEYRSKEIDKVVKHLEKLNMDRIKEENKIQENFQREISHQKDINNEQNQIIEDLSGRLKKLMITSYALFSIMMVIIILILVGVL